MHGAAARFTGAACAGARGCTTYADDCTARASILSCAELPAMKRAGRVSNKGRARCRLRKNEKFVDSSSTVGGHVVT
eukprot:5911250-Prymnesium_polylepis.1